MILSNHQKFASPEEALQHFGVKGMAAKKDPIWGGLTTMEKRLDD